MNNNKNNISNKERYQRIASREQSSSLHPSLGGGESESESSSESEDENAIMENIDTESLARSIPYSDRHDGDEDDDNDHHHHHHPAAAAAANSVVDIITLTSEPLRRGRVITNATRKRRVVDRRRNSRGSYSSVLSGGGDLMSDDDDELEDLASSSHEENATDNNFHDHPPRSRNSSSHGGSLGGSLSDLHSYLSGTGTQSPFNTSFDNDDDNDDDDDDVDDDHHLETGPSGISSSRGPASPRSNGTASIPAAETTATKKNTSHLYSFGLDDDDDDFEEEYDIHLKRYAIDFGGGGAAGGGNDRYSSTTASNTIHSLTNSVHGGGLGGAMNSLSFQSSTGSDLCWCGPSYLWFRFQTARQRARQRRAQLLLQQSDRRWQHSLYICLVTTLCDATDGGIALAATALVVWTLLLWQVTDVGMRNQILVVGILVWTVRFGARPAREYWIQHRRHRWRREQSHHHQSSLRGQQSSSSSSAPSSSLEPSPHHHYHHRQQQQQLSSKKRPNVNNNNNNNNSSNSTNNRIMRGRGDTNNGVFHQDDGRRSRSSSPTVTFAFAQPPPPPPPPPAGAGAAQEPSMELTTLPDGISTEPSMTISPTGIMDCLSSNSHHSSATNPVEDPLFHII